VRAQGGGEMAGAEAGGGNLAVLDALDSARTQMYHMKAIVIAGMGFFTDAYDLFCISTVSKLLGRLYYPYENMNYDKLKDSKPGTLPMSINNMVVGVALVGTLLGQLVFGYFGDKLGRKRVYGITLVLMAACAIASGLSFGSSARAVIGTLCFFRFWLGFGIGGDYPLSATIMSEYSNKKTRGAFIAAVFAMQGVGIIFAGLVSMIVSALLLHYNHAPSFWEAITNDPNHDPVASAQKPAADYMWRIVLMIGALPALATFYWRMKMPETARYTALIEGNAKQAASDMEKVMDVEIQAEQDKLARYKAANDYPLLSAEFARRHGMHLIGTATTWFLLDIAFYSQNLTQKDIFPAMKLTSAAKDVNALTEVFQISKAMFLVALLGTFPGYWVTVALIDKMGRYLIQLLGFFMMSVFMLIMGVMYENLKEHNHAIFALFYALTFFFANFGPNSTTFVLPAELFPTRVRSTCHAISAASGKAGAIVAAYGVQSLTLKGEVKYIRKALIILSITNMLGFFFTFLVPETMGRSLEEISGEDGNNAGTGPAAPAGGPGMGAADVSRDDKMPVSSTEWQSSMHA
jgi:PHS family inorganic phosphate transporter-like MFS transporter